MADVKQKMEKASGFMKGLFPLKQYVQEANELINDCFGRHDVPQGDHIPVHLKDTQGLGLETSNGFPVSGIFAQEDYHIGGASPTIPIVIGIWGVVMGLCTTLINIKLSWLAMLIGFSYVCFLIRTVGIGLTLGLMVMSYFGQSVAMVISLLPGIGGAITGLLSSHGTVLNYLFKLLPLTIPYVYYRNVSRSYADTLADVGSKYNGTIVNHLQGNAEARTKQVANTLKDNTWFNILGHATGRLSAKGDSFSPDAGLPFGQSIKDQQLHLFITGASGSGKTTLLKNVMAGVVKDEIWSQEKKALELGITENEVRAKVERIFADRIANKKPQ